MGADGRVVICTDGSGTSSTANTLLIYDGSQASQNQVLAVRFPSGTANAPSPSAVGGEATTNSTEGCNAHPTENTLSASVPSPNNTSTVVYVYESRFRHGAPEPNGHRTIEHACHVA